MAKLGKRTTAAREAFAGKSNVTVDEASAKAVEKIEAAGGSVDSGDDDEWDED